MTDTPWAVLLCTFSDDTTQPFPRSRYEELFTAAGAGTWNMTDYFRDMSLGSVNLDGSQVFGWFTLPKKRAEYVGSGANPDGREDLITWARQAAVDAGIDLSPFFSVVVCANYGVDLFGGGSGVVCGDDGGNLTLSGVCPSYLGQEFGHRYGLNHSRLEGSQTDYQDPFDVMSTAGSTRMTPQPGRPERDVRGNSVYRIGPGLNAANMKLAGWLDPNRVVRIGEDVVVNRTVTLRPLHRRDLSGTLAIRFGRYYVEFRHDSGWDAGLERPMVLVHRIHSGISYLQPDHDGQVAGSVGSEWGTTKELSVLGAMVSISVESIDPNPDSPSATVRLIHSGADLGPFRKEPTFDPGRIRPDDLRTEEIVRETRLRIPEVDGPAVT